MQVIIIILIIIIIFIDEYKEQKYKIHQYRFKNSIIKLMQVF